MEAEIINSENFEATELDDGYFKFCTFDNLSPSGGLIASDFNSCTFKHIDWYWGLFSSCNFIQCQFTDCMFRGTSFADCRFVECVFSNCQFLKDNLNGNCTFESSVAYGCSIDSGQGFEARILS